MTSTPFARKSVAKSRKTLGVKKIKVDVHDGHASRSIEVTTSLGYLDFHEKVATTMKRPYNLVELGYEAPWSSKLSGKKIRSYVSNEKELDEFWFSLEKHLKAQKAKKGKKDDDTVDGIVFHNMLDSTPVRSFSFTRLRCTNFIGTKPAGRAKEVKGSKVTKNAEPGLDARDSAQTKVVESTKLVQAAMHCKRHNRTCYPKYCADKVGDRCGVYAPDNILEHATLLVCRGAILGRPKLS